MLVPVMTNPDGDALLNSRLGAPGWKRLCDFSDYPDGWGEHGTGLPLSPAALDTLRRVLVVVEFPTGFVPSVFLTKSGHLGLSWEDAEKKSIHLEFTPKVVSYFFEKGNVEGEVSAADVRALIALLRGVNAVVA